MHRLICLAGLVVSLVGAVGIATYGGAVAGSLDVFVISDESRHSDALASLPAAMISMMALVLGLVVVRVAATRLGGRSTTGGLLLAVAAGLLLVAGGCLSAWSVGQALLGVMVMSQSETAPKPEDVELVVRYAEPFRVVGASLVTLSAALSLVAGLLGFRDGPSTGDVIDRVVRWVSVGAGVILVCLAAWAWRHGSALQGLMAADVYPRPNETVADVRGILGTAWFVFAGIGVLGLLDVAAELVAFVRFPRARPD